MNADCLANAAAVAIEIEADADAGLDAEGPTTDSTTAAAIEVAANVQNAAAVEATSIPNADADCQVASLVSARDTPINNYNNGRIAEVAAKSDAIEIADNSDSVSWKACSSHTAAATNLNAVRVAENSDAVSWKDCVK